MRDMTIKVTGKDNGAGSEFRITWLRVVAGAIVTGAFMFVASYSAMRMESARHMAGFEEWKKPVDELVNRKFPALEAQVNVIDRSGTAASGELRRRVDGHDLSLRDVTAKMDEQNKLMSEAIAQLRVVASKLENLEKRLP